MEIIKPSSILRDYNKVVDEVKEGEPIILTKNGVGKAVMVNYDEWQKIEAEIWLLRELNRAEEEFGEGEDIEEFAMKYKLGEFSE